MKLDTTYLRDQAQRIDAVFAEFDLDCTVEEYPANDSSTLTVTATKTRLVSFNHVQYRKRVQLPLVRAINLYDTSLLDSLLQAALRDLASELHKDSLPSTALMNILKGYV